MSVFLVLSINDNNDCLLFSLQVWLASGFGYASYPRSGIFMVRGRTVCQPRLPDCPHSISLQSKVSQARGAVKSILLLVVPMLVAPMLVALPALLQANGQCGQSQPGPAHHRPWTALSAFRMKCWRHLDVLGSSLMKPRSRPRTITRDTPCGRDFKTCRVKWYWSCIPLAIPVL